MSRPSLSDHRQLEALLDERDHLLIRISLLTDAATPDVNEVADLRVQLRDVDRSIAAINRAPSKTATLSASGTRSRKVGSPPPFPRAD